MSTNTLLLLGIGGVGLYLLTRPRSLPPLIAPPPNPYNSVAGYTPPANYPSDPSDRNSWVPGVVAGAVGGLGNILSTAFNAGGASTSSGTMNGDSSFNAFGDPYDTGYTNPTGDGLNSYGGGPGGPTGYGFDYGD